METLLVLGKPPFAIAALEARLHAAGFANKIIVIDEASKTSESGSSAAAILICEPKSLLPLAVLHDYPHAPLLLAGIDSTSIDSAGGERPILQMPAELDIITANLVFLLKAQAQQRQVIELQTRVETLQARFADYGALTSDWFWETDAELRYTYISRGFFRTSGFTPEELIGDQQGQGLLSAEHQSTRDYLADMQARRAFNNSVLHLATKAGNPLVVEVSGRPRFDASGKFLGYRGAGRDITKRYQTEIMRELNEQRFADFADLAADWFWETDAELRYTYLSERYEQLTGTKVNSMVGRPRWETFQAYASDETDWRAHFEKVKNREPFEVEFVWRNEAGVRRYVLSIGKPLFDDKGAFIGYRGIGKDLTKQRDAERALRESEHLMRVIADHCPLEIAVKDRQGRYIYVNKHVETVCRIPLEKYLGRLPSDVYEPELAAQVMAHDQEVLRTGKVIERREKISRNGRNAWQLSIKFPIRNENNEITGLGAAVVDYTEQARAQEALRKSEELFRNLIEGSLQGILIHDTQRILFINQAAVDIFGLENIDAAMQIIPHAVIAPHEHARLAEYAQKRFKGEDAPLHYEIDGIHADGRLLKLQVSARAIEINDIQAIQITIIDISGLRHAEHALMNEMHLNRLVLQSAQDGFCVIDMQARIQSVNDAFLRMLGYQRHEVINMPLARFEIGGHHIRFAERRDLINRENTDRFETRYRNKQGELIDVEVSVTLAAHDDEQFFFSFVRNISDRKLAEAKLKEYQDHLEELVSDRTLELQKAVKEQESFSYSVSHDLRAPLRAIDGFCKILMDDYGSRLDSTATGYLQRVRAASQRMGVLIDALLDLSRMSRRRLQMQSVDISGLAVTIMQLLQASQPERHVEITIQKDMHAQGDDNLLRIALENLLGNAWKYTSQTAAAKIELSSETVGDEQIFLIKDNGVGFNMKYAHKLFGAFQRLHAMHEFEGTGIGLATVARIIERHGGRVWAEAEPDKGAKFYFALPRLRVVRNTSPLSSQLDSSETWQTQRHR